MTKSQKTSSKSRFHIETYNDWDIAVHRQCMGPPWVAIARKLLSPGKIHMFNTEGMSPEAALEVARVKIDGGLQ